VFDSEDFKLVDGWWTFPEVVEESGTVRGVGDPCKTVREPVPDSSRNPLSARESAQRLPKKWPLDRAFRADARTRTGDPFITS
jgi:hypothetical protein